MANLNGVIERNVSLSPSDGNSMLVRGNLFSEENERPFEVKTKKTFSAALPERVDLVKKIHHCSTQNTGFALFTS
jgi:hypothetical protein